MDSDKRTLYTISFKRKLADKIQSYLLKDYKDKIVPMRWNKKEQEIRHMTFAVIGDETHEKFLQIMEGLLTKHGDDMQIKNSFETYCAECGTQYEFRQENRTGQKSCKECNSNRFVIDK